MLKIEDFKPVSGKTNQWTAGDVLYVGREGQALESVIAEATANIPYVPKTNAQVDQEVLNTALTAEGSVVRALGLITFEEINKLRVKAALPAYTMPQFVTALQAKMRG